MTLQEAAEAYRLACLELKEAITRAADANHAYDEAVRARAAAGEKRELARTQLLNLAAATD